MTLKEVKQKKVKKVIPNQALTYSSSETLGWMLQKAVTCLMVEDGDIEEG